MPAAPFQIMKEDKSAAPLKMFSRPNVVQQRALKGCLSRRHREIFWDAAESAFQGFGIVRFDRIKMKLLLKSHQIGGWQKNIRKLIVKKPGNALETFNLGFWKISVKKPERIQKRPAAFVKRQRSSAWNMQVQHTGILIEDPFPLTLCKHYGWLHCFSTGMNDVACHAVIGLL